MLPYHYDASRKLHFLDVINMVSKERSEDAHIFYQFFVNVYDPDSVGILKDAVLNKRDKAIFEQAKIQDTCRKL